MMMLFSGKMEDERLVSDVKLATIKIRWFIDKIIFGLVRKGANPAGPSSSKVLKYEKVLIL
jgi:hypothetical protein